MSGPPEPQWDLLPDHPEAFFGLSGEYDLRDLKRSYNALLRRFKPEKFPEEFQRIRAAFEQLNDALRYGETLYSEPERSHQQFDWNQNEEADTQSHAWQQSDQATPELRSLQERITTEPLPDLYRELADKELKTPYDYYALAMLSDVLPLQDPEPRFVSWLLEGIQAHPSEPGLFQLLRVYCDTDLTAEQLEQLLETTSKTIHTNRFYYLTEKAWDQLLDKVPFSTFRRIFENCESRLLDHTFYYQQQFYLHLLKRAIWKADRDWIDDLMAALNNCHESMPRWCERELEHLHQLRKYQEQRTGFLAGGPVRALIDQAIVDYYTNNDADAVSGFLRHLTDLVTLEDEVLREFEVPDEDHFHVRLVWEGITDEIFYQLEPELVEEFGSEELELEAQQIAKQLMLQGVGLRFRRVANYRIFLFVLTLFILVAGPLYLLIGILSAFWMTLLKIIGLELAFLAFGIPQLYMTEWFAERYYREVWRFELRWYFQKKPVPYFELCAALEQMDSFEFEDIDKWASCFEEIAEMMRKDIGLFFYASSRRLLAACP